ncbi:hypothetical protein B0H13DRAFT_2341144 [Mycena leptocephala]|nr:hypothetical protein B0H13DRAFT_2341144 [Mycena leptocephala]
MPGYSKSTVPNLRYANPVNAMKTLLRAALGRKATSLGYLLTNEKGIRHLLRQWMATESRSAPSRVRAPLRTRAYEPRSAYVLLAPQLPAPPRLSPVLSG